MTYYCSVTKIRLAFLMPFATTCVRMRDCKWQKVGSIHLHQVHRKSRHASLLRVSRRPTTTNQLICNSILNDYIKCIYFSCLCYLLSYSLIYCGFQNSEISYRSNINIVVGWMVMDVDSQQPMSKTNEVKKNELKKPLRSLLKRNFD
jgi:hypothetical protein